MTKMKLPILACILFALAGGEANAQPRSDQSAQTSDEIVVVGERTRGAIRNFVSQMSIAPGRNDHDGNQLARWNDNLCPGVAGLRTRYAQFLIDRMAQRAEAVGLDVGRPGCRANVLIVVSPDADATARDLFEHNKRLMGYYQEIGHRTLGRRALAAFVNSDAPVRWWHVSRTITKDGDVIGETANGRPPNVPGFSPGDPTPPVVMLGSGHSRLSATTHQDFGVAFVIVDARQLQGVSFEALADYLAMVTLAQLDPDADTTPYPTILNLFRAQADRPQAMTDWDVAYLQGLYGATRDARNANQQEGEIADHIAHAASSSTEQH